MYLLVWVYLCVGKRLAANGDTINLKKNRMRTNPKKKRLELVTKHCKLMINMKHCEAMLMVLSLYFSKFSIVCLMLTAWAELNLIRPKYTFERNKNNFHLRISIRTKCAILSESLKHFQFLFITHNSSSNNGSRSK